MERLFSLVGWVLLVLMSVGTILMLGSRWEVRPPNLADIAVDKDGTPIGPLILAPHRTVIEEILLIVMPGVFAATFVYLVADRYRSYRQMARLRKRLADIVGTTPKQGQATGTSGGGQRQEIGSHDERNGGVAPI